MKLWLGSILVIATPALGVDEDILNSLTDLFENPEPVEERAELMPWTVDTPAPAPFSFLYRARVIESTDPGTRHLLNFERLPESIRGCRNPHLLHDAEVVLRVTGQIAPLRLGPLIARQSGSVLYEVDGWPDMVFKYQVNCDCLLEDFHPLTRDFAFLKFLKSTGATPQVYISSRGTKFEFSPRTLKTDFRITGEAQKKMC